MRDRIIQLIAAIVLVISILGAGMMQPKMIAIADRDELRYTDVSVDGAPPIVALGTAIGALRGLIVDYLWLKVTLQKEKGLLYEVMADTDLITKLQPRFPDVWAFHGHNMAYNISVMTNTPEERWAWVNAGISLVRDKGIRYNPNDLILCKELAFWFGHKIDGTSDDAHLYYKRQFAREWQYLLGVPPFDMKERVAWIKLIADAPDSLAALYVKSPGTKEFVEDLEKRLLPLPERFHFAPDKRFLMLFGEWAAQQTSPYAQALGLKASAGDVSSLVDVFKATFGNDTRKDQASAVVAFLRTRCFGRVVEASLVSIASRMTSISSSRSITIVLKSRLCKRSLAAGSSAMTRSAATMSRASTIPAGSKCSTSISKCSTTSIIKCVARVPTPSSTSTKTS